MKGVVVWFTGLPSSGKTSLAEAVRQRLTIQGAPCCTLDGDVVRGLIRPPIGYAGKDRDNFYQTLGGLAVLLARQGMIALVSATAPLARHRAYGRSDGAAFVEVYVETAPAECERRDDKGLYQKARNGEIKDFPGVSAEYEKPAAPDVVAPGGVSDGAVAAVCFAVANAREE